jgi:hypothetical protein
MPKLKKPEVNADVLKGWQQIATFLGQPVSVAQRWATEGIPVKREGRYVESSRAELNRWLGRESAGEPVQIATEGTDLGAELKRGLSYVKKQTRAQKKNKAA